VGWASAALAVFVLLPGARAAGPPPGWATYGGEPGRSNATTASVPADSIRPAFVLPLRGRVTSQVVAARDVPRRGLTTLYVATSAGRVYAFSENGYVRWQADLGQYANACAQLDGYGVTGTPVIDQAARILYIVDGVGRLHALDLATGGERDGWPVTLYPDTANELVWGALTLAAGHVYAATGSYCDAGPFIGKVISVDTATRSVASWETVPAERGGGGGVWGWGGSAFSSALDALFVVTGNAFEGGLNTGLDFTESAGFGESVVSLSPSLEVIGASHPLSVQEPLDLDFVGSPVVAEPAGCGRLVFGMDKNAQLFGWQADDLARGPLWTVDLESFDPDNPVLSQLAYDPARRALYAVTGTQAVRIDIRSDCSAAVRWHLPLQTDSLNGSPTVAGGTVWLSTSGGPGLVGLEAGTGRLVATLPLPGLTVTAPTVLDGRLFIGTFTGQLVAFDSPAAPAVPIGPSSPQVPGHSSWLDPRHGWVSRENGVWATDDGGTHWRRISARPAAEVVRTSARAGVIRVTAVAAGCTCANDYWTVDGGAHWVATRAIQGELIGRGSSLYWIGGGGTQIERVSPWPPARRLVSEPVATADSGTIVDTALAPGGIDALVRDPIAGTLSLLLVGGDATDSIALPPAPGDLIGQSLSVSGTSMTVDATVFAGGTTERYRWSSTGDRGTWSPVSGERLDGK
jgi:PQQ-like domain